MSGSLTRASKWLAAFVVLVALSWNPWAWAQEMDEHDHDHDHDHGPELEQVEGDLGRRIRHLEDMIICACPNEKWTRTLTFCPDSCANPQKRQVRSLVDEGKTDQEIYDWMVQVYKDRRVLAAPAFEGIGAFTYVLPVLIFTACVVFALLVIFWWSKSRVGTAAQDAGAGSVSQKELDRVEQELESLD